MDVNAIICLLKATIFLTARPEPSVYYQHSVRAVYEFVFTEISSLFCFRFEDVKIVVIGLLVFNSGVTLS